MTMHFFQKYIPFMALCAMSLGLAAQPGGNLPSDNVEVVKDFQARLAETERLNAVPGLPPLDTSVQRLNYRVQPRLLQLGYAPPVIRPIAMSPEALADTYRGYVKAGFGTPMSPYVNAFYNGSDGERYAWGAEVLHHSANNDARRENQRFALTQGRLNGSYFFPQGFAASGQAGYTLDEVHFYGYEPSDTSFSREAARQRFGTFDLGARFYNALPTLGKLNYQVDLGFYQMGDNYDSDETGLLAGAKLNKFFGEAHEAGIALLNDFSAFNDTATQNINVFSGNLYYRYVSPGFGLKVGAGLAFADSFHLFPDVEISANLMGTTLSAFAGWTGQVRKNTFRSLSDYNPFVLSALQLQNSAYQSIFAGIKGRQIGLSYELAFAYKMIGAQPLFLNAPDDARRFAVLYDDVDAINVHLSVEGTLAEAYQLFAALDYNNYSSATQEKAWHLPVFEGNIGARTRFLEDKLQVRAETYFAAGVPYLDANGSAATLNGLFDLSLGAQYQLSEQFGLFLDANNLLNSRRQRWNAYPIFGINVMGGIVAKF